MLGPPAPSPPTTLEDRTPANGFPSLRRGDGLGRTGRGRRSPGFHLPHSVGEMPPKEAEGAQPGYPNPRSAIPADRPGPEPHSRWHSGPQAVCGTHPPTPTAPAGHLSRPQGRERRPTGRASTGAPRRRGDAFGPRSTDRDDPGDHATLQHDIQLAGCVTAEGDDLAEDSKVAGPVGGIGCRAVLVPE